MKKCSTAEPAASAFDGEAWFDPIEQGLRGRIKQFIEELVEQEATAALGRRGMSTKCHAPVFGCVTHGGACQDDSGRQPADSHAAAPEIGA